MKVKRKIIEIDEELCDGCGQCVLACAEGSLEIIDGKAKVISDNLCDGLGACLGECPQDALTIIEREAEEFDEEAVEAHLAARDEKEQKPSLQMPCGCPSTQIQNLPPQPAATAADADAAPAVSELSHWPVMIRLVPPTAPFLKGADLLIAADCVPVAFPTLHRDFLKGRKVMIGCPKFDDAEDYVQKLTEIFHTAGPSSITTVVMEVPCCAGLRKIVRSAYENAGCRASLKEVVVATDGKIKAREAVMA